MRRDMNLVREILKASAEETCSMYDALAVLSGQEPHYDEDLVAYHLDIMRDAGLINAMVVRSANGVPLEAWVNGLTWKGNDLLELLLDGDSPRPTRG